MFTLVLLCCSLVVVVMVVVVLLLPLLLPPHITASTKELWPENSATSLTRTSHNAKLASEIAN